MTIDMNEASSAPVDAAQTVSRKVSRQSRGVPVPPRSNNRLMPAPKGSVRLQRGFWLDRQKTNHSKTLPHEVKYLDLSGVLSNFDAVVDGSIAGCRKGREFVDSDAYKVVEALSWENGRDFDPDLEAAVQSVSSRFAPAAHDDGYISTEFGNPGQAPRYSDMEWGHELYCLGHLILAAVARLRNDLGQLEDPVVALGIKAADHICNTFGVDGLQLIDGHPGVELALIDLYRETGNRKYLEQAKLFVDRRGHRTLSDIEFGREYFQDETPVREMDVLEGHAVRALYLLAASIDLAVEYDDVELLATLESQYLRTLERRTYLTGGMGSRHQDEAFGEDFELPSDRAYCESCAGVASIMVAWRLLLATGDVRYSDIIERTYYNLVAPALSATGTEFFYANTLHQRTKKPLQRPGTIVPRASTGQRASWFSVSCCPPNLSRIISQFQSFLFTYTNSGLQLLQYHASNIDLDMGAAGCVKLRVDTDYPFDGKVVIVVDEVPVTDWRLGLRIPAWCENPVVEGPREPSWVHSDLVEFQDLEAGDVITLGFDTEPKYLFPRMEIDGTRGCVAVERGPLVYCLESTDQTEGIEINRIAVDVSVPPLVKGDKVFVRGFQYKEAETQLPYRTGVMDKEVKPVELILRPYYSWANNGPSAMRVWLPIKE